MAETFDVLIRLITEMSGEGGIKTVGDAMGALEKKIADVDKELSKQQNLLKESEALAGDLKSAMDALPFDDPKYKALSKDFQTVNATIKEQKATITGLTNEYKKYSGAANELQKAQENQEKSTIKNLKMQARALTSLANLRSKELKELKERADWIERGAKPLFTVGVAGMTSIAMLAKKYIDTTEESNEVTKAWAASTQKVSDAQMKIGKVAAEAVLPIYEKLANIAMKGAEFVEKNPGAIEAGLKASIVLAGLGGIGLLATKGMRLYADIKMIAVGDMQLLAAKIMSDAATKQLAAAGKGGVGGLAGAGGLAKGAAVGGGGAAAGTVAAGITAVAAAFLAALGGVIAGGAIVDLINAKKIEAGLADTSLETAKKGMLLWGQIMPAALEKAGIMSTKTRASIYELQKSILGLKTASEKAAEANRVGAKASADATNGIRALAQSTIGMTNVSISASNALLKQAASISSAAGRIGARTMDYSGGASISVGGGAPTHDYTGYAYSRTYRMAQDGQRQFVMSGGMTRLAEQMLGRQLNQQVILSALSSGGSKRVVWQDQRRFSGEYTKAMRRAQRADTLAVLNEVANDL